MSETLAGAPGDAVRVTQGGARHRRAGGWRTRHSVLVAAFIAFVVLEALVWLLLRSQGWVVTGDSPGYLLAAQSLAHFTLNPIPELRLDYVSHHVFAWPAGVPVADLGRSYLGPHGYVFAQGLGVPLLLAPFALIGGETLSLLGFFALVGAGLLLAHQRASSLVGLGWRGQALLGLAMAAPATLLAATQVYPDLLTGVFLACALVELARMEQQKAASALSLTIVGVAACAVPWFQIKNIAAVFVVLAALVVIALRHRLPWRGAAIVVGLAVLSFVLLLAYNDYYFSHVLGLPQPNPALHNREIENLLALVFDRHQGFLIQVPTTVLGLVGLCLARRRVPWSIVATVLGAGAILVINGTQPGTQPMGGTALAGRFEWSVVPMLLVWAAVPLKKLETSRRAVWTIGGVVGALWLVEGLLIAFNHHVLVNSIIAPFKPFDPTLYPGWWGWLDHFLPSFLLSGWKWNLAAEILGFVAVAVLLAWLATPSRGRRSWALGAVAALAVLTVLVSAVGKTTTLPQGPVAYSQAQLGGPWSTQAVYSTVPIPLVPIGAGTYDVTVSYRLTSASGGSATVDVDTHPPAALDVSGWFTPFHFADAADVQVTSPLFPASQQQRAGSLRLVATGPGAGARTLATSFVVHRSELMSLQLRIAASTKLQIASVSLSKVGGP